MNINTNKIYISWLRRKHLAFRLEHNVEDSCSILETASCILCKDRQALSLFFFFLKSWLCRSLWLGVSEIADFSMLRMLKLKLIEEAYSAEKGYFSLSENQMFICCALSGWAPCIRILRTLVSVPSCTGNTGSSTFIWVQIQALQGKCLAFYVFWKSCM